MLDALALGEEEVGQALELMRWAGVEEPERLLLGDGDRRLLELHRVVGGDDLELTFHCGACGTVNSLALSPESVPARRERQARLGRGGGLREPTYGDLRGLPSAQDEAAVELLRRCVVGTPERLPTDADLDLVDDSLSGPLVASCAECAAEVAMPLDVQRLVLESLQLRLDDIELEVHLLARAYHWDLRSIENLPDERRSRLATFVSEGR
jgi:hypothetical protein